MRARSLGTLNGIAIAIALVMGTASAAASAQVQAQAAETRRYEIPAGLLRDGLRQFGLQSRLQVLAPPELTGSLRGRAVNGSYTARQALEQLLDGSGLSWEFVNATTVVIKQAATLPVEAGAGNPRQAPQARVVDSEPATLGAITITGTRIRGGTTPSPVITISAEHIREEGFADLGDVIRNIPQNFGGGQNPGVVTATGSGNNYNQNGSGGSALNLRGLGADATLTLLNGRRLPNSGFGQAVDISAIPIDAVARIDIVADGASAIYGSDAVAGVGNVVLRRDFEGLTVGTRHGGATEGGLTTREYDAVAGITWAGGGLMATYKDVTSDPIRADQRDYTRHMDLPFVLYPGSELRSGLLSAYQALGERVVLQLDAFRTERTQTWYQSYAGFHYENGADTATSSVAPSLEIALPGEWVATLGAAWGRERLVNRTDLVQAGTRTLLLDGCYCNDGEAFDAGAEGPIFLLPAGEARLAVGLGRRKSEYVNLSYLRGTREGGTLTSRHAYGELELPLVGPDMDVAGVRRLVLSAALRSEHYDSFGGVTTPKLGLIYSPGSDATFKVSWGESFKAPMLSQLYANRVVALWTAAAVGGTSYPADATVLMTFGGNPDLEPERAKTLSASLAFHPAAVPGLEAELTWFRIRYDQRVVQPLPLYSQSLSNPALADFIQYAPAADDLAAVLSAYPDAFYNYAGVPYDPQSVVAIAYAQFANATEQRIRGVDLSGSYRMNLAAGRLSLRGSASWLDSEQRSTARQAPFDLAGTLFYPAKINGRLGAVWSSGGLTASTFANYVDGLTDRTTGQKTASFSTLDATIRYVLDGRGPWSGLELSLTGQNLLNRAPPLYTQVSPATVPYDSTNHSAIGRFLSVAVSKRW